MRVGFIRARFVSEVDAFRSSLELQLDKLCVTLSTVNDGISLVDQLDELLNAVKTDDVICVPSFENVFKDTSQLCSFIGRCFEKDVKLFSLKGNVSVTKDINPRELMDIISRPSEPQQVIATRTRIGRPPVEYPAGFWDTYCRFRNKEVTSTEAAEVLGIKVYKFYKLVREFEH